VGRIVVSLTVMLVAALAGTPTLAQTSGGKSGGGLSTSHLPPVRPVPDAKPDAPVALSAQVQVSLERTADDLRITAGQEKLWNAYATRVMRLADDISRARFVPRDIQIENFTAPQVFDRITEVAQNRLTAVEEIADAGRALYAQMTPTQQRIADRRLAGIALSLASGTPPSRNDESAAAKPRAP
jgi:hypothetical protein